MIKGRLTDVSAVRRLTLRRGIFPNLEYAGSYDYFAQTIRINVIDADTLAILGEAPLDVQRRFASVTSHESTHWLDHLTTLWGQETLVDLFNSISAFESGHEAEFWRIRSTRAALDRIHFPDYYSNIGTAGMRWDGKPWRQRLTVGRQFGADGRVRRDRPILFARFSTFTDDRPVARVPLSVASLVETTAVSSELWANMWELVKAAPEDRARIDEERSKSGVNELYDSDLCVYSVCAHLLANHCRLFNAFEAYQIAASLATVCLELPNDLFPLVRRPRIVEEGNDDLREAHDLLLAQRDRGYLFFALVEHSPVEISLERSSTAIADWIAAALSVAGLPTRSEIGRLATEWKRALPHSVMKGSEQERCLELLQAGRRMAERRGLGLGKTYVEVAGENPNVDMPPLLLPDGTLISYGLPTERAFSLDEHADWINRSFGHYDRLARFNAACIP